MPSQALNIVDMIVVAAIGACTMDNTYPGRGMLVSMGK